MTKMRGKRRQWTRREKRREEREDKKEVHEPLESIWIKAIFFFFFFVRCSARWKARRSWLVPAFANAKSKDSLPRRGTGSAFFHGTGPRDGNARPVVPRGFIDSIAFHGASYIPSPLITTPEPDSSLGLWKIQDARECLVRRIAYEKPESLG